MKRDGDSFLKEAKNASKRHAKDDTTIPAVKLRKFGLKMSFGATSMDDLFGPEELNQIKGNNNFSGQAMKYTSSNPSVESAKPSTYKSMRQAESFPEPDLHWLEADTTQD